MQFPDIDPVAFYILSFPVRWYGLSYMLGIVLGLLLARRYAHRYKEFGIRPEVVDDFWFWATIGILVGGRLGYILLYRPDYYLQNPIAVLHLQEGGMSFHGGFLGVLLAAALFCRQRGIPILKLTDPIACVVPIGLGLGRTANFVNGELWGRTTTVSWGMVFPSGGPLPRHPSQLYEVALEGVLMFCVLNTLIRSRRIRLYHGFLTGAFGVLYGTIRCIIEFYREPDASLILGLTRGQAYSIPMVLIGIALIALSLRKPGSDAPTPATG